MINICYIQQWHHFFIVRDGNFNSLSANTGNFNSLSFSSISPSSNHIITLPNGNFPVISPYQIPASTNGNTILVSNTTLGSSSYQLPGIVGYKCRFIASSVTANAFCFIVAPQGAYFKGNLQTASSTVGGSRTTTFTTTSSSTETRIEIGASILTIGDYLDVQVVSSTVVMVSGSSAYDGIAFQSQS